MAAAACRLGLVLRGLALATATAVSCVASAAHAASFEAEQRRNPRVRAAFEAREPAVATLFRTAGAPFPPKGILLRAFKREAELELWADRGDGRYVLVRTYAICAKSGALGPKRREGDGQVPEGFYRIIHFNPASAFHLSLGIDYPNAADRHASAAPRGGSIYVHGDCVTIGCIPITDEWIEEVYVAAVLARSAGQTAIPVHLFPARLTDAFFAEATRAPGDSARLVPFWRNLRDGYDRFERDRRPPRVSVGADGRYLFD